DDLTGFPEMMDGRVKTLHPNVHGGLLARRDDPAHMAAAEEHGIGMIDMIIVNLYAFQATIAKEGVAFEEAIENIDIGGPSMLRSAAKNHASVAVVTSPSMYTSILDEMRANGGSLTSQTRAMLALEVFRTTSAYDNAIYTWMQGQINGASYFAPEKRLFLTKEADLRYGENPHQQAAFYKLDNPDFEVGCKDYTLSNAVKIQGKELSYNNYLDLDAAWAAVREFEGASACVIVKHLTPCGIAKGEDIVAAYKAAHECDPVSAYGGVMAFNRTVTAALVEAIYDNNQFIEAVIAPSFDEGALELFTQKPNARILATGGLNPAGTGLEYRSVEGGILAQQLDTVGEDPAGFSVPTKRQPTDAEMEEMLFAWKACKSIKSNAILITKNGATVGAGAGQPNRLNSARIAVEQAGEKAKGAVAASDAFMPFADSLEVLIGAGVTAVIQPGGSIRDDECIAAADAAGVALVFTGHRHFRH
ncbi:MAG: bifunctional phosphoribosylaminoimidazolecarboxamide formyltransferase/IMP cyclohydrolase, partial [Actinobacteria bacterium]|nr:bifunctional phosphoribosylaminoimidazolecarboxamide formyltransferase/IMP cyclohydrolase [Actinomycetota bacterium]